MRSDAIRNRIIVFGAERDLERFRRLFEIDEEPGICLDNFISPPLVYTKLPLNHKQSSIHGLLHWRQNSQGCLIVKSRYHTPTKRIARYVVHTKHGDMLKFLHVTSMGFDELEFNLTVRDGNERSRFYIKGGNVEPMSERSL